MVIQVIRLGMSCYGPCVRRQPNISKIDMPCLCLQGKRAAYCKVPHFGTEGVIPQRTDTGVLMGWFFFASEETCCYVGLGILGMKSPFCKEHATFLSAR